MVDLESIPRTEIQEDDEFHFACGDVWVVDDVDLDEGVIRWHVVGSLMLLTRDIEDLSFYQGKLMRHRIVTLSDVEDLWTA